MANKIIESGMAYIKPEFVVARDKNDEPDCKKPKIDNVVSKKRGQNKNRHNKTAIGNEPKLCHSVIQNSPGGCVYPSCKFLHSLDKYLELKPADISDKCYLYDTFGHCPRGITCRFASGHDNQSTTAACANVKDDLLSNEAKIAIRKKKYDFSRANKIVEAVLKNTGAECEEDTESAEQPENLQTAPVENNKISDALSEIGFNPREKTSIDWKNKLYLSPLTTLGNLPFRRICKEWGADITCGEMAMSSNVLQGQASEWALLRRHPSETLFGVQLCGNNAHTLARCCQLIEDVKAADFIDLNLGCPIELVYQRGAGSGLLRREKKLESVVRSMALSTRLPVTVKTRTGIYQDKLVAQRLMPMFKGAGAAMITVHGRTREQRYTRNADWEYIEKCANAAKDIPVFGNGDILSFEDYNAAMEHQSISGVMIGRGALYKPWIFTEIKEQRHWDISSSERLDILKKFANYGFEHWGSDTRGVETTRRFLLEWLSFLYRYIPVQLLEHLPQKINERPPQYFGRNDLETLMASPNCADWVKISEMLCGPVPEDFHFVPKHKANSWA